MEITRLQPFPLEFSVEGFDPDTEYVVSMMDNHSFDLVEIPVTSDGNGLISTPLPDYFSRYDQEYRAEIYVSNGLDSDGSYLLGDLLWVDTLTIMRPYIDVNLLSTNPEDIEELSKYESLARSIINSMTEGFLYKRQVVEVVGLGNDFLALPSRVNKVVRVYENDILVYDSEPTDPEWTNTYQYYVTPDKGAISIKMPNSTGYNRIQSKVPYRIKGASDSFTLYNTNDSPNYSESTSYDTKVFVDGAGGSPMFASGWDYVVIFDSGWPIIPQDIKQATELLINDLKCNTLPYLNSYISSYSTDQYQIKFDPGAFKGTGNDIVDKILSNYPRTINRMGVI
jgi:hypothetical protein